MTIMLFDNLNIAVLDDAGEQVPVLQRSVARLLAEHAEKHGYDLDGAIIETPHAKWQAFRTPDGWNHRFVGGAA